MTYDFGSSVASRSAFACRPLVRSCHASPQLSNENLARLPLNNVHACVISWTCRLHMVAAFNSNRPGLGVGTERRIAAGRGSRVLRQPNANKLASRYGPHSRWRRGENDEDENKDIETCGEGSFRVSTEINTALPDPRRTMSLPKNSVSFVCYIFVIPAVTKGSVTTIQ
ncbi:hypothetical protein T265_08350 [Opisthorchis viverrini]|uniref:Uncharacterized protein n=2 Tax=Opisthorchis viverrini TaxID=6198 RepID=A0A074Z9P9_OPIVI|nr:hypothetical protein T265_08350 [Opisthorchis viverrini]KER23843.1 hypothetical protein T265_08350 [Opisthorchis viverrini]